MLQEFRRLKGQGLADHFLGSKIISIHYKFIQHLHEVCSRPIYRRRCKMSKILSNYIATKEYITYKTTRLVDLLFVSTPPSQRVETD